MMAEITETQLKLRDAGTQMKIALQNTGDEDIFRSCINSYISLARSVTFVMQKESSPYPELLSWYEIQMNSLKQLPIMKFFHAQRTHTIHRGVIKPVSKTTPIFNLVVNGEPKTGRAIMQRWLFDDVKKHIPVSSSNVLTLCEEYFIILKTLVREWLKQKTTIESKKP